MAEFTDDMTLKQARALLRDLARGDGHSCPVCTQFAKVYHRAITGSMAAALVTFYRRTGAMTWGYVPDILKDRREWAGGDWGKLRYWGLIEEEPIVRPDGGRAGFWRITEKGEEFIKELRVVPRRVLVFDGKSLGYEDVGDQVGIRDRLGKKFNLDRLMAGLQ